tara:strand:+ start:730 stop:1422 length:693 start_codon:yes stop_codon:yes gene_type:complete
MKSVGIIGGLGPETTAKFYLELISSCQIYNKKAYPRILISSVALPYKIEKEAMVENKNIRKCLPFLLSEAKSLEKAGADFLVMPCNSLHVFIEDIRKTVNIPVLSILEEVCYFLTEKLFKKVGIVSTVLTRENKLYENELLKNKIKVVYPFDGEQRDIGNIIHRIVRNESSGLDQDRLVSVIHNLQRKNADCVVLACTDLQLIFPKYLGLPLYDSMKIFVDATVREILSR